MIDNKLHVRVRIQEKSKSFDKLLGGRCFILTSALPKIGEVRVTVFIKLNKRWAQAIDDNNYRIEFEASREVNELVLVAEAVPVQV